MDSTTRLRIATRIHFALLRNYGEDVAVRTLLENDAHGREALWVCEASGDDELAALGKQLETANRQEARAVRLRNHQLGVEASMAAPRGATAQDLSWSQDTSGFGLTRPPQAAAPSPVTSGNWFRPANWLRRGTAGGAD